MKNLYDIYEDGIGAIASTPANTVGMGNPMLPTAEEPGTEPLVTAKCKKDKKKKKQVKEGILDDIEISIDKGDKAMEFVNWYIDQCCKELGYKKYEPKKDELITDLYSMVTVDKDTVIIDMSKGKSSELEFDIMVIYDTHMPSFIKTLKIYNQGIYAFDIQSYFTDISNFDIEIYKDNGKSYGSLNVALKTKNNDTITLGNITCDKLIINARKAETLVLKPNSIILELYASSMYTLKEIIDRRALHHLQKIEVPKKYVLNQLCQAGILPWGIDLKLVN